jgi:nucleoside 2-deoxyribosyltransferase
VKVYISGPISGIANGNREAFELHADYLRQVGVEPINPHEVTKHLPEGSEWIDFMRADISAMMEADAVLMLPEWLDSRGARIEFHLAFLLEIPVHRSVSALMDWAARNE